MADTRLRAIIESIYKGEGAAAAQKDFEGLGNKAKGAKPGVEELSQSTFSLSGVLTKLAAGGLLLKIGQAALEFGKASIQAAGDAAEMASKFDVVFGESAPQALSALEDLGEQVNRSAVDLSAMASSIQDTFVPLGFARDEAAGLSIELTKLAVDVASFNNAADTDVMRDFQSALVGNTETVRKYGIVITEANTKQKAYEMGLASVGEELTEQQKVQARLQLIMEGTSDAQGDAIRTADSYANTQKGLEAATKDLQVALGNLATQQLAGVNEEAATLIGNLTDLIGWIGKIKEITAEHNKEVALSTASYEEYAAEVVRVAVANGDLNEKQGAIVLKTMLTRDANEALSMTMAKITENIGLMTEEERIQLQQTNSLALAYEAAGVSAYVWKDALEEGATTSEQAGGWQAYLTDTLISARDETEAMSEVLGDYNYEQEAAARAAEEAAEKLADEAAAIAEAQAEAEAFNLEKLRSELSQDVSSPLEGLIQDIDFMMASGGQNFAAAMAEIEQSVADGKITPEQGKEFFAALLVGIDEAKVAAGQMDLSEAKKHITDTLGITAAEADAMFSEVTSVTDTLADLHATITVNADELAAAQLQADQLSNSEIFIMADSTDATQALDEFKSEFDDVAAQAEVFTPLEDGLSGVASNAEAARQAILRLQDAIDQVDTSNLTPFIAESPPPLGEGLDYIAAAMPAVTEALSKLSGSTEGLESLIDFGDAFSGLGGSAGGVFKSGSIDPLKAQIKGLDEAIKQVNKDLEAGNLDFYAQEALQSQLLALQKERATASAQLAENESKITELQKQQQQLGFLKEQLDFIKFLKENNLDLSAFSGLQLGANADPAAIIEAMTQALGQVVAGLGSGIGQPNAAFASGVTDFVVPPGYPNDSFMVGLTSGEPVTVGKRADNNMSITFDLRWAFISSQAEFDRMLQTGLRKAGLQANIYRLTK